MVVVTLDSSLRYYQKEDARNSIQYISGTKLDDRIIRVDWDIGFMEGRQYGRGKSGGQVRDEYRCVCVCVCVVMVGVFYPLTRS